MGYLGHLLIAFIPQVSVLAGLQLLYRQAGLVSLAQASLMGVGGYVYLALSILGFQELILSLILGPICAALVCAVLLPVVYWGEEWFTVCTFSLQLLLGALFNSVPVLGGESGVRGLASPTLIGFPLTEVGTMIFLTVVSTATTLCVYSLQKGDFNLTLRLAAGNPSLAADLGIASKNVRFAAFCTSAALAGMGGVCVAALRSGVSPDDFGIWQSVLLLTATLLAWDRFAFSAVCAGGILVLLGEATQLVTSFSGAHKILFGVLIILVASRERTNE